MTNAGESDLGTAEARAGAGDQAGTRGRAAAIHAARGLLAWVLARDWLVLGAVLMLAAATRLPGIATRGRFDGDQGYDMLQLLRFTRDGVFPLLGPPTSIGDFHHGAFYYLLLAPVAALSNSDPLAVVTFIALLGIGAVGVTWWLARSIGGPVAGLIAGVLLALSPAGIDESTFLWNPNPIPLFAAISLAAAWQGHRTRHARWWILALASAGVVFQLHVLGVVFLPPLFVFLGVEVRRALHEGDRAMAGRLIRAGVAGIGIIALLFVPLAIHEVQTGFSETQRAIAYFTAGSGSSNGLDPATRLLFALLRIVGWPFVGVVTDAPIGSLLVVVAAIALGAWATRGTGGEIRFAARWLTGTVAWATIALTILAPSLQTVIAGLPNDHYHAFLDPVIVVLVAVAVVALGRRVATRTAATAAAPVVAEPRPPEPRRAALIGPAILAIGLVAVLAFEVSRWPVTDPNGGWPAARASGARIVATTGASPVALVDVPVFKTPMGTGFPIVYAGGTLADDPWTASFIVVPCDRLFESVVGARCAGPAEDQEIATLAANGSHPLPVLVTRFDASPRISISIYRP